MRYEDARPLIQTGDLIAVKRRSGPLAVGTRLVTGSPYTHTGLALWVGNKCESGGRLLIAHSTAGGGNLVPLSQEAEFDFDVFACPVDRAEVEDWIWQLLDVRFNYGFSDLWRIFLYLKLGIPLPQDDKDLICSAMSAALYKLAGWNPPGLPSIP